MPAMSAPLVMTVPLAPVEVFLLVLTRLLAALATSPVFSARTVPAQARIGLGAFTALVLTPVVMTDPSLSAQPPALTWSAIAGEALAGALVGFAASLVYAAIQFGAGLLDVQAGFGMASTYDPTFGSQGATLERFYSALAALLFLQVNGHHLFIQALGELFAVVPLGTFGPARLQPMWLVEIAGVMLRLALQLVLPIVGALLLADVALALLARAAPQFNLFAVGIPAKVGLALGAALLVLPTSLPQMSSLFKLAAQAAAGVLR